MKQHLTKKRPGMSNAEGQIILYQTGDGKVAVNVRFEGETFWMTQKAIAELFEADRSVITKHLTNIYAEGELGKEATCAKIAQVQTEGSRAVTRQVEFYNLDAIIAVGYRVNSKKATRFRQWATRTLKDYKAMPAINQFVGISGGKCSQWNPEAPLNNRSRILYSGKCRPFVDCFGECEFRVC